MRAVFSAMRRSLMRLVMALASSGRGARSTSRSVCRTAMLPSRTDAWGLVSSDVITRAPGCDCESRKSEKGSRQSGLPLMEPTWVRRFDWIPADLDMVGRLFGCGLRHHRHHRHVDAAFGFGAELDVTVHEGEQGVIPAQPDIAARMPLGAALARQNVARDDALTAENLEPEALAVGVAAVA